MLKVRQKSFGPAEDRTPVVRSVISHYSSGRRCAGYKLTNGTYIELYTLRGFLVATAWWVLRLQMKTSRYGSTVAVNSHSHTFDKRWCSRLRAGKWTNNLSLLACYRASGLGELFGGIQLDQARAPWVPLWTWKLTSGFIKGVSFLNQLSDLYNQEGFRSTETITLNYRSMDNPVIKVSGYNRDDRGSVPARNCQFE
jgi:hypothetical protein